MKWLIWSHEHCAWWAPNNNGYVGDVTLAGRYEYDDAVKIVRNSNATLYFRSIPEETMIPEEALPERFRLK